MPNIAFISHFGPPDGEMGGFLERNGECTDCTLVLPRPCACWRRMAVATMKKASVIAQNVVSARSPTLTLPQRCSVSLVPLRHRALCVCSSSTMVVAVKEIKGDVQKTPDMP